MYSYQILFAPFIRTKEALKIGRLLILFGGLILSNSVSADKYSGSAHYSCRKIGTFRAGQCVEVDGHLLYVKSFGLPPNKNNPTVVFLPGSGNTHYV